MADKKQNTEKKEKAQTVKAEAAEKTDKKSEKSAAELEKAKKEIEELKAKDAESQNKYLRLYAEFDTFRRRSAEEKLSLVNSAAADTIKGLLPVLDDCERAMEILASSSDEAAREGTTLIYNKLMEYLKSRGLTPIEAKGQKFDTDFHEAVTQFPAPSEDMKGMVLDVIQTGYLLNGKILRYAKVVVGA